MGVRNRDKQSDNGLVVQGLHAYLVQSYDVSDLSVQSKLKLRIRDARPSQLKELLADCCI